MGLADDYGRRPSGTHQMLGVQNDAALCFYNLVTPLAVSGSQAAPAACSSVSMEVQVHDISSPALLEC